MTDAADLPALHLTAREAAAELGVSPATLYAYVSRGLIRSEARAGSRQRLYRADDVRALAARRGGERADATAGAGAGRDGLAFGDPVLDSAITLITGEGLFYRGRNAARLAAEARLETVAGLIWEAAADPFAAAAPPVPETVARTAPALAALRPIDRCQALLPVVAAADPQAHNATPDGRHRTAARILRWMAALATGSDPDDRSIHEALVNGWGLDPAAANPLRIALALCADHELNASTFAVRVAASTGAPLHAAVQAGLATLSGPRHGGMTERAGALLDGLLTVPDPEAEFAERLRRGDDLPGFGHPLYPAGDPRAATLIAALETAFTGHPDLPAMRAIDTAARDRAGRPPTIDAALALLARLGGLPAGGALAVFAVGRCVGWIGHALEQQATGRLIRPRARYVGRRV